MKPVGNHDLHELFDYLDKRGFNAYPKLIYDLETRENVHVFKKYEETKMPNEQKALDMIDLVSRLHHKTTFFKTVNKGDYDKIYEDVENDINYYQVKYADMWQSIINKPYYSPSEYLFLRHFSKINSALTYALNNIEEWYQLVKDSTSERVVLNHANLKVDHYLKGEEEVLISWDNALIDTPIKDLVILYRNEFLNIDFVNIFKRYMANYELNDAELKLLNSIIAIPGDLSFNSDQFLNIKNIREQLDYIYKTEQVLEGIN